MTYKILNKSDNKKPIKAWVKGVLFDENAKNQLINISTLDFIYPHIAVMPDVHLGIGATIGAVIPTIKTIIPAAVGVDIGCGVLAVMTNLKKDDLLEHAEHRKHKKHLEHAKNVEYEENAKHAEKVIHEKIKKIRKAIENAVPHGRTNKGGKKDIGAFKNIPFSVSNRWKDHLQKGYEKICKKHPNAKCSNNINHLGTLGTGNHFIEVCFDENKNIWIMLHSGSRGCGNKIGRYFIDLAKKEMQRKKINLADPNLAYFKEGEEYFDDYLFAVNWATEFANQNRLEMIDNIEKALKKIFAQFKLTDFMINCHHNYVQLENHFGKDLFITRKGALSAKKGEYGIIPGSMGEKSFIVRGLGNVDSFCSCSHGAGRVMSRNQAKRKFSIQRHIEATKNIECRKDRGVLDETPDAYKDINSVIRAQDDLIEIVHTLKQIICIKG